VVVDLAKKINSPTTLHHGCEPEEETTQEKAREEIQ